MTSKDLARIPIFAALIAALGLIPAQGVGLAVPFTAQTLGVMLAGALLTPLVAGASVAVFVALTLAGLPLLPASPTRPQGGLALVSYPSMGFMIGWILGAMVCSVLVTALWRSNNRLKVLSLAVALIIGGILVVYFFAIAYSVTVLGMALSTAYINLAAPYFAVDLIKVAIATVIASAVRRAMPQLTGTVAI